MDLRRKSVRGSVWSLGNAALRRLINFAVFPVLARLLVPEDFGIIAYAGVVLAVSEVFVDQGLGVAITQRDDLERRHIDAAFWMNMVAGLAIAGSIFAAAGWLTDSLNAPGLGPILRALSIVLVLRAGSVVQTALLRRDFRFKAITGASVTAAALGGVVGVGAAIGGWGVWSLVAQQITQAGIELVLISARCPWAPRLSFDFVAAKELLSFSAHVLGASLLNVVSRRFDDFLIGYVLGAEALGYYSMAYRVLQLGIQFLVSPTNRVALSTFSRLQGDRERLKEAFLTAVRLSATLAAPAFFGLAVLSRDFVGVVLGPGWQPTVQVLQLLALAGVRFSLNYYDSSVHFALRRPDIRMKLLMMHTTANVIAFLIAVQYGIVAVAAAFVLRTYVLSPVDLTVLTRLLPMRIGEYLGQLVTPLACSAIMSVTLIGVEATLSGWEGLVAGIVVGVITYAIALRVVNAGAYHEVLGVVREVFRST